MSSTALSTPPPSTTNPTILPLTTIFTPPPSCLDAPFTLEGSTSGVAGFSFAWRDGGETSSLCYPSSYSALQWDWGWYSPGVCPSGWTIGESSTLLQSAVPPLTQAWCCPADMTIYGSTGSDGNYQFCTSLASSQAVLVTSGSVVATTTYEGTFVAYQWPLSVEWAASDLSRFDPPSAPVLAVASTTPSISSSSSRSSAGTSVAHASPTTVSSGASGGSGGLSTGGKAGVAVAVVAVVLALIGFIVWLLRRRRVMKKEQGSGTETKVEQLYLDGKIELPHEGATIPYHAGPTSGLEGSSRQTQEMDVPNQHRSLPVHNQTSPVELDGRGHKAAVISRYA